MKHTTTSIDYKGHRLAVSHADCYLETGDDIRGVFVGEHPDDIKNILSGDSRDELADAVNTLNRYEAEVSLTNWSKANRLMAEFDRCEVAA